MPPTFAEHTKNMMSRVLMLVALVAHTDALVMGSATRLQHRRVAMAPSMGLFDSFKNAFMEKEAFDDRSAKGASPLTLSLQLSATILSSQLSASAPSYQPLAPSPASPQPRRSVAAHPLPRQLRWQPSTFCSRAATSMRGPSPPRRSRRRSRPVTPPSRRPPGSSPSAPAARRRPRARLAPSSRARWWRPSTPTSSTLRKPRPDLPSHPRPALGPRRKEASYPRCLARAYCDPLESLPPAMRALPLMQSACGPLLLVAPRSALPPLPSLSDSPRARLQTVGVQDTAVSDAPLDLLCLRTVTSPVLRDPSS